MKIPKKAWKELLRRHDALTERVTELERETNALRKSFRLVLESLPTQDLVRVQQNFDTHAEQALDAVADDTASVERIH